MLTPSQTQFLGLAADAAVQSEKSTGVPAPLTLAQAIFESGWGSACPGNNCFGIKSNGRGCGTVEVPTREFIAGRWTVQKLAFERYASLIDCFVDHGWLLAHGQPYATAFAKLRAVGNVDTFILEVGGKYATAPNYGQTILNFSKSLVVVAALDKARRQAMI